MATPLPQTDPVAMLTALLSSGGNVQTSNAGDTSLLQQTFANAGALDPNALLQAIFAQAGGQIPGLQNAFANAVGARRSGNSGVANALSQLLAQTTLAGQKQVMDQKQNLLQTQANVAGTVAQATAGTKKSTTPDVANSAKNLLMLQGLAKLADTDIGKSLLGTAKGTASGTTGTVNTAPGLAAAGAPQMSMAPAAMAAPLSLNSLLQSAVAEPQTPVTVNDYSAEMSQAPAAMFEPVDVMSYFGDVTQPEISMAPEGFIPEFNIMDFLQ